MVGSSRCERGIGDRARGRDPLQLGGLLDLAQLLDPAVGRHQLDTPAPPPASRLQSAAGRSPPRRPRRPRAGDASAGQRSTGRCRRPRCARPGTAPRAWTGSASRPARRPRRPRPGTGRRRRDLFLASRELEAGQVAGVLATDAEVGVDALASRRVRKRSRRSAERLIGGEPAADAGAVDRGGAAHGLPYFLMFARCSS